MARIGAAAVAAMLLAAAGTGAAPSTSRSISYGPARRIGIGAAAGTLSGSRRVPSPSASPSGGLRRDTGGADLAAHARRVTLVFLKKKTKKKVKSLRGIVDLPAAHAVRVPATDRGPVKVSPQAHPSIPLLRTVLLLA
jgi:hypothetical protein